MFVLCIAPWDALTILRVDLDVCVDLTYPSVSQEQSTLNIIKSSRIMGTQTRVAESEEVIH